MLFVNYSELLCGISHFLNASKLQRAIAIIFTNLKNIMILHRVGILPVFFLSAAEQKNKAKLYFSWTKLIAKCFTGMYRITFTNLLNITFDRIRN